MFSLHKAGKSVIILLYMATHLPWNVAANAAAKEAIVLRNLMSDILR
jgi:hypothetical protein